jgi:hypothetical protein
MHALQKDYRELFNSIQGKHSRPLYWYVLAPWVESHTTERDWLRSFAYRSDNPTTPADVVDLWRLYALGRVNEVLLLRFQPGRADGKD